MHCHCICIGINIYSFGLAVTSGLGIDITRLLKYKAEERWPACAF